MHFATEKDLQLPIISSIFRPLSKQARQSLWSDERLSEIVQNAVIVSKAVYADTDLVCEKYLMGSVEDHNLNSIIRSRHGSCNFAIAEEQKRDRIYISFR